MEPYRSMANIFFSKKIILKNKEETSTASALLLSIIPNWTSLQFACGSLGWERVN